VRPTGRRRIIRAAPGESFGGEGFSMRLGRSRKVWIGSLVVVCLAVALPGFAVWRRSQADPNAIQSIAEKAYQSGRHAQADALLKRLERIRPPTPIDHYLRFQVDQALMRDEDALAELAAIPDDHPLAPLARLRAGQTEIRRGRTRPAEAAFLAALKLLPRAVQPHKELVFIYNIQHRQAELDEQLIALLDLNVLDFQYILHWTKTRNTIWNPKGDLPALEKFVAADPGDRWSRLALVEALRRLNRLDDAERILAVLSQSEPGARTKRALIAIDRGDFAAAESILAEGRDDDPLLAQLRGQLALRRRDGPAAVRYYRIALAADPIDRAALSGLGTALSLAGQAGAAQPYMVAASRHDELWRLVARAATTDGERDPKLPHQLGMACAAARRYQEARAWLMLAIERDPLDADSQRTLSELEHAAPTRSAAEKRSAIDSAGS
jgi:predicted Zn-dependent protease